MNLLRSARHRILASRWVLLVVALESTVAVLPAQEGDGAAAPAAPAMPPAVRSSDPPQQRGTQRARRRTRRVRRPALPPLRHTTPKGEVALASDLGTMLGARVRNGRWGVMVVSLSRGDTLYSVNPDLLLSPASNMKLYTAALALEQFGPDHQFGTDVLRDGVVTPDGTLQGNLVMRGDGDPALSSRFLQGGPAAPVELLAQLVASRGIKRVSGDLIADASAFDQRRIPDGWQRRYLHAGYAARVSALSLNENLLWIVVQPGATSKQPAQVVLDPATELPLANKVRTVAGSRAARVIVRTLGDGTVEVRGWIGTRAGTRRYQIVVEDPAMFTAGAFRRALEAQGITVAGQTRLGETSDTAAVVASLPSPPLARLLSVMNRESVNHYAELIFRNAARSSNGGPGTVESANQLLQRFMTEKVGAAPGTVFAADGSGLSVLDRVTPRSLIQLLDYAHRAPWSDVFHTSLPVAGESELLRHRMRLTPAQGNLHAKTGTTNTVISLGGYVTAESGEVLAFAFIYNGSDLNKAKETIDAMGATLASWVRD
ncbi:MAG TPA: D-alanyl-D-alanine carboxypeptidase/D-alanyl-D-alanine-endopeptidase [Gemmatimonadaceae bacterium]|jgi:D-alanyl-D-alanine carboxypeptidase/D-alanyl-D-alanine-endopeptidase (penicillin-binding protein 4)